MTSGQKVIKYVAIAFAIFLIVNIISSIFMGIFFFGKILDFKDSVKEGSNYITDDMSIISTDVEKISNLDIELGASKLEIMSGDTFKVETNNSRVSFKENNGRVEIKENTNGFTWNINKESVVRIYIPDSMEFIDNVDIENGAGTLEIEALNANVFDMELGAGAAVIENLNVEKKTKISTGAGKAEIISSNLHDVDLEVGVGEFDFNGTITGRGNIEAGVGTIKMHLEDGLENYTINMDKGLGDIKVAGDSISDSKEIGNGQSYLRIEGGVGSINID